jgi:hypothetical protein
MLVRPAIILATILVALARVAYPYFTQAQTPTGRVVDVVRSAGLNLLSLSVKGAEPVINTADEAFLRDQALRVVASARLAAGQSYGKWHNATPYTLRVPGGNMGYTAFWVRDSVMMLGGDLISAEEVEGWIRLITATLRGKDWNIRPDVVVPAYTVPDHINFDGEPTYYPGNYETGDKQGGESFGNYPPLDDNFYFLIALYDHWKMTRSLSLFRSPAKTSFAETRLDDLSERVYQAAPVDPTTGLCVAGDVRTENAKDFGFCDGEFKSGKLLFPSVLRFIAARQLAEMFDADGRPEKARKFREDAVRIQRAIPMTFFHPSEHQHEGWLYSATGVGNQPDVWGSAFAVFSGAVDGPVARKVARALVRAFHDESAVRQGCVREILTTDVTNKGGWQSSVVPLGEYQNGGYWGTATGWYVAAMANVDRQAAAYMAKDYIQFLKSHMRADGMTEAWEWFNPDTGKHNNPLYVATVALPYVSMKQAGLLVGN